MVIAVDFDGTLCKHSFPEIGEVENEHQRVADFVRHRKKRFNDTIILWTCRENTNDRNYLDEAVKFCNENDIPIDYVNENTDENKALFKNKDGNDGRKILADVYIDDKAFDLNNIPFYLNQRLNLNTLENSYLHPSWIKEALKYYEQNKQVFGIDGNMTVGAFVLKHYVNNYVNNNESLDDESLDDEVLDDEVLDDENIKL